MSVPRPCSKKPVWTPFLMLTNYLPWLFLALAAIFAALWFKARLADNASIKATNRLKLAMAFLIVAILLLYPFT